MKEKTNLDLFDLSEYPRDFKRYLKNYGFHFTKKCVDYAVKELKKENPATKRLEPIDPWDKDKVDDLLKRFNIVLEDNELHDYVWVCNMLRSDMFKSSIPDEQHLAMGVKDMVDDKDQRDGFIFNRWVNDRMFNGSPIDWAELL